MTTNYTDLVLAYSDVMEKGEAIQLGYVSQDYYYHRSPSKEEKEGLEKFRGQWLFQRESYVQEMEIILDELRALTSNPRLNYSLKAELEEVDASLDNFF